MDDDTRLLTGILAAAAEIIRIGSNHLNGTVGHGTAPDHIFERFEAEARDIVEACKRRHRERTIGAGR